MFHPKVQYENLEVKFNEKPFYLGGSQVPQSLNIKNDNLDINDDKPTKGSGLKSIYHKNKRFLKN